MCFFKKNILFLISFLYLSIICLQSCKKERDIDSLSQLLEKGEEFSGGATTTFDESINAFGNPAPNLDSDKSLNFPVGNALFNRNWVTAPASTEDLDGVGPLFNARSCSACHFKDGRGKAPAPNESALSLLVRLSVVGKGQHNGELPDPHYGGQFNNRSIFSVAKEGDLYVDWEEIPGTYPDGSSYSLRKPKLRFENLGYGDFSANILMSPRVAPQMVGMGLLEAIDEGTLLSLADPEDSDKDGISGKINQVWDVEHNKFRMGRFGWKSNQPSVRQQVAGAFLGDIGISSTIFPNQDCADNQTDCKDAVTGGNPELKDVFLELVTLYSSSLAVPARRNWKDKDILKGQQLFMEAQCNACHIQKIKTGKHPDFPEFSNQVIRPYTDLLLHDMGDGLADGRPDFDATGKEWRTAPLWGIGLVKTVNGHKEFLHDGRARGFEEAILWHGGEAEKSKQTFMNFKKTDREKVIKFIESL